MGLAPLHYNEGMPSRCPWSRCLVAGVCLVTLAGAPLTAHDGDSVRLAELDALLESAPRAEWYLERAELLRSAGRWAQAGRDLARSARLAPHSRELDLARARLWVDTRLFRAALPLLDRLLAESSPERPELLRLRARALAQAGRLAAAAGDLGSLISAGETHPELYLERARLLRRLALEQPENDQRGLLESAWRGLQAGLAELGSVPSLEEEALAIEEELGWTARALQHLARLADATARPERWLVRRAELLVAAGRPIEGRQAFEEARAALAALSPRHRRTRAMLSLARRIDNGLGALSSHCPR